MGQEKSLAIIVAMGRDGAIGKDNNLLWHLPGDLPRFRSLTSGHAVIMGRRTWESLPSKPLPKRKNIVITTDSGYNAPGAVVVNSPAEALAACGDDDMPFVIGGGSIYNVFQPLATHLFLTYVDSDTPDADTFLPPSFTCGFKEVMTQPGKESETAPSFCFIDLIRE